MGKSSRRRKQYCQVLPALQEAKQWLEDKLSDLPKPDFLLETGIKPFPRTVEKAQENRVKSLTDLSDLVRGRIYFSDNFEHHEVIGLLKEILRDKIKKIDAKHSHQLGLDYNGVVHCDLDLGGIKFELQILPVEFLPYKEALHQIYEHLRGSKELPEERKAKLREIHNKIYKHVNRQYRKNRDHLEK